MGNVDSLGKYYFQFPVSTSKVSTGKPATSITDSISQADVRKAEYDDALRSGSLALLYPSISMSGFINIMSNFGDIFSVKPAETGTEKGISLMKMLRDFELSLNDIVSKFLDDWVDAEKALAELARKNQKELDLAYFDALARTTQKIHHAISEANAPIPSMCSLLLLASTIDTKNSSENISPLDLSIFSSLPTALMEEISSVYNGILFQALAWAAPAAITLGALENPAEMEKSSAKAFAISLGALLTNPQVDDLLKDQLSNAVANHNIDQKTADGLIPCFKASLLIQSTALLYKSEFGGITPEELKAIITGTMSFPENDFLTTMGKLVNEQLALLDDQTKEQLLKDCFKKYGDSSGLNSPLKPMVEFLSLWDPSILNPGPASA
jgi:hypothetical protein